MLAYSLTKEKINDKTKFIELTSKLTTYDFFDGTRNKNIITFTVKTIVTNFK